MVSNSMLNDPNLSLQAKGLLAIFLSNSPDWEIQMKEIIQRSKNGRDAHYKAVQELIEQGYFYRKQITENGKFKEMLYIFSDNKDDVLEAVKQLENEGGLPFPENPKTGEEKTLPENPDTENQETNNTNNTKDNNTKKYVSKYVSRGAFQKFQEFFKLTRYASKELKALTEEHGEVLVIEAIQRTAEKEKDEKPIAYMKGILRKWKEAGVKTTEDIKSYEAKHREEQKKKKQKRKQKASGNPTQNPAESPHSKLPKAILEQMEQAQKEAAATIEMDKPLSEEEFEEKRRRIQEKIRMMAQMKG